MEKLIQFLQDKPVLIISENQNTKVSLKKIFSELGIKSQSILDAETFISAEKLIQDNESHFLVLDYELEGDNTRNLIELYKAKNPNSLNNILALLCVEESDNFKIDIKEYDIDLHFIAPFTFNDFKESFQEAIETKSQIGLFERALFEMQDAIAEEDFDKVENFLTKFEEKHIDDARFKLFRARYKYKIGLFEKAMEILSEIVAEDDKHYRASVMLYDIYIEMNEFDKAKTIINTYMQYYPLHASRIESYIKTCLMTKSYDDIINFGIKTQVHGGLGEKCYRAIAAGMIIASNQVKSINKDLTFSAAQKAIKLSQFTPNLIGSLRIMIDIGQGEEVRRIIEGLESYQVNDQIRVLEYKAMQLNESDKNVYLKGIELIQAGVIDFDVYDIMIKTAIKVGRKKASIEEAIEDASKHFPEKESYFYSILTT